MRGSTASNQSEGLEPKPGAGSAGYHRWMPLPGPLALAFIFTSGLSLAGGLRRGELAAVLLGAVLGAVLAYTFAAALVLALAHAGKAARLLVRLVPEAAAVGEGGITVLERGGAEKRFFRLPGMLLRCQISLYTQDGRKLELVFDPDGMEGGAAPFTMPLRGAYSGASGATDRLLVTDALGLFRASARIPSAAGVRLLSMPPSAEPPPLPPAAGGGEKRRGGKTWKSTDNFIEHRPYTPGDDPRRINWKLYGHSGDLFVRENEREPPPESRLLLLIDTFCDPRLYTPGAGPPAADLLCETALSLITGYLRQDMEVFLGWTGGGIRPCENPQDAARALAYPAAYFPEGKSPRRNPWQGANGANNGELPSAGEEKRVLVLALPRREDRGDTAIFPGGLDKFLRDRGRGSSGQGHYTDVLFLPGREELFPEAEDCAARYAKKPGVRAFGVPVTADGKESKPESRGK